MKITQKAKDYGKALAVAAPIAFYSLFGANTAEAQVKSKPTGDLSSELSTILSKYMGHDDNGIYVIIRDDEQTRKDFRNEYFSQSRNRFNCINNVMTTLDALMSPANSQNPKNQEGKANYFYRNELPQRKLKDGTLMADKEFYMTDMDATSTSFPIRTMMYNVKDEQRLGLNLPNNLNDYHDGKLYLAPEDAKRFIEAANSWAKYSTTSGGLQDKVDELRDFYEGWVIDLKRDNEGLTENNNNLRHRNMELADKNYTLSDMLSRIGVYPSAGITSVGGTTMPNYGLVGGVTNGFKLGFKYMGESKEEMPTSTTTQEKKHPVLPATGYSQTTTNGESKMHGWEASAHVPLSRELYVIGAVGQLAKTDLEKSVSTTWFESNGNKFDVHTIPYQSEDTKKAMTYGGGLGLELSPMYLTATVTASPKFEPTYTLSAGFNIAKLFGKDN